MTLRTTPVTDIEIRPCGDSAVLVEVGALDEALALHAALRAKPPAGLVDLVPAARTVLVKVQPGTDLRALEHAIRDVSSLAGGEVRTASVGEVEIPVVYDGEDLAEVAADTGRTVAEVIADHTSRTWTVAFTGFAPGFGYLVSDREQPAVARRSVPRTKVPPGSVALAGQFSAVYPRESPGGWQLVGRTQVPVWDLERTPPALLVPGTRVTFCEQR